MMRENGKLPRLLVLPATLTFLFLVPLSVLSAGSAEPYNEELVASSISVVDQNQDIEKAKASYLKKLSPGGKAYFLANRRDYAEALKALDQCSKRGSGSASYVRAFCLEGLGRHKDSILAFQKAEKQIGLYFNPTSRFYVHSAVPFEEIRDFAKCRKYLSKAREVAVKESFDVSDGRNLVLSLVQRRQAVLEEKSGQARKAFEGYLAIFGTARGQFHINETQTANPAIVAKARAWLATNPQPKSKRPIDQAIHLLKFGEAQLLMGNERLAKESLLSAAAVRNKELLFTDKRLGSASVRREELKLHNATKPIHLANQVRYVATDSLVKVNDKANALLINLFLKDGNYAGACQAIRNTFFIDPAHESKFRYWAISMRDVPEIVTKKDVELHSLQTESILTMQPCLVGNYDIEHDPKKN